MTKNPKVSVIIPTYNRAELLSRAIESVLNQTFKDFELIIVDDGSTDNTKEVVKKFQEKDKRIRYIWQENSGGAAKPKNTGIKNSRGEYIAILDSDDEWLPDKLVKQVKLFESSTNQKLGFVGCYMWIVDEKIGKEVEYKIPQYKNVLKHILTRDYMGSGSSIMYKKSVFDIVGLFDENLKSAQDWEMRIRLAQEYDFDFVKEPLVKYYVHEKNLTKALNKSNLIQHQKYILKKHRIIYDKYPKAYSIRLRNIGSLYLLNNELRQARKYFIKAVRITPWYPRSWMNLIVFFLGKSLYKKILYQKKIAGNLLRQSYEIEVKNGSRK